MSRRGRSSSRDRGSYQRSRRSESRSRSRSRSRDRGERSNRSERDRIERSRKDDSYDRHRAYERSRERKESTHEGEKDKFNRDIDLYREKKRRETVDPSDSREYMSSSPIDPKSTRLSELDTKKQKEERLALVMNLTKGNIHQFFFLSFVCRYCNYFQFQGNDESAKEDHKETNNDDELDPMKAFGFAGFDSTKVI